MPPTAEHHDHDPQPTVAPEAHHHMHSSPSVGSETDAGPFSRSIRGLEEAQETPVIDLRDGDRFELRAAPVRNRVGRHVVRMLGYNGSIPGPTLRVPQGARLTVDFTNRTELETTVHWHGLRLDHRFDGVPTGPHGGMQPPVPPGGRCTYQLVFPDAGVYWYHPHLREDYAQEHGLYGNLVVVPSDPAYWPPVNRELTLVVDDLLMENGRIVPFDRSRVDHLVSGRFGNVMLLNGQPAAQLEAQVGEVVRLYLTNTANVRNFRLRIPGARLKLVGSDGGRCERGDFVEQVRIAPSERMVVDALFEQPGRLPIEHHSSGQIFPLGQVEVRAEPVERSFAAAFAAQPVSPELAAERARLGRDLERAPDKTISLVGQGAGADDVVWQIVDQETGAANHAIDWTFSVGERVKIRIVNEAEPERSMPHPFHLHGERFLVLSRNGVPNPNLVWKDTVLVEIGETVDLLLETSNPGTWMAHCHIAEHLEAHMMFNFRVVEG